MDPSSEEGNDRVQRRQGPRLLPISDASAAYRLIFERIDALVRGRAGIADLTVPACPAGNLSPPYWPRSSAP